MVLNHAHFRLKHAWDWFKAGMLGCAQSLACIGMVARAFYFWTHSRGIIHVNEFNGQIKLLLQVLA